FSRDWSSDVCSSDLVGEVVGIELERTAHRLEVGFAQRGNESVFVGEVALHLAQCGIQQAGGVVRLSGVHGRCALVCLFKGLDERSEERRVGKECMSA